jgi:SAM-dependent methyltransferase
VSDQLYRSQLKSWGQVDKTVFNFIRHYASGKILDAGSSRGMYVNKLQSLGYTAFGCDVFLWEEWNSNPLHPFAQANILNLPFSDESFDTVFCINVLEHINDVNEALQMFSRVCKKGGNIILAVPNCEFPFEFGWSGLTYAHWIDRSHVQFYDIDSLRKLLTHEQFRVVDIVKMGDIRPELLFFTSLRIPFSLARVLTAILQRIPGRRSYSPMLAAVMTRRF